MIKSSAARPGFFNERKKSEYCYLYPLWSYKIKDASKVIPCYNTNDYEGQTKIILNEAALAHCE